MKLSAVLKAALLRRLVGVDPREACDLAEGVGRDQPAAPPSDLRRGGPVSKQVADLLGQGQRFRTASPYTRGFAPKKVEICVSRN